MRIPLKYCRGHQSGRMLSLTKNILLTGACGLMGLNVYAIIHIPMNYQGQFASTTTISDTKADTRDLDIGDFDGNGVQTTNDRLNTDGAKKLFYLQYAPVHKFIGIKVNGVDLPSRNVSTQQINYTFHTKQGWVSLKNVYSSTDVVVAQYKYSTNLDVITANGKTDSQHSVIYLNQNRNKYIEKKFPVIPNEFSSAILAEDFDQDSSSTLDVIKADGASHQLKFFKNSGGASFSITPLTASWPSHSDIADLKSVDIDGDGDLDVVVARELYSCLSCAYDPMKASYSTILRNVGGGQFILSWMSEGDVYHSSVEPNDYDLDGDPDLLIANNTSTRFEMWENQLSSGSYIHLFSAQGYVVHRFDPDLTYIDSVADISNPINFMDFDTDYAYMSHNSASKITIHNRLDFRVINQFNVPSPLGIAVDSDHIYVANSLNKQIIKYKKSDLSSLSTYSLLPTQIPYGLAIDTTSAVLYVSFSDAANPDGLYGLNTNTMAPVYSLISEGAADNQVNAPRGIAYDAIGGHLFVADSGNCRVLKLNNDLGFNQKAGTCGIGAGQFTTISGVDAINGYVYAVDSNSSRVTIFNKETMVLARTVNGSGAPNYSPLSLYQLANVSIDPNPTETRVVKLVQHNMPTYNCTSRVIMVDLNNDGRQEVVGSFDPIGITIPSLPTVFDDSMIAYTLSSIAGVPSLTESWRSYDTNGALDVAARDLDKDDFSDLVMVSRITPDNLAIFNNEAGFGFISDWRSSSAVGYDGYKSAVVKIADMNNNGNYELVSSAARSLTSPFAGFVQHGIPIPVSHRVKVTVTSGTGRYAVKIIQRYETNSDGSLGSLISTQVR